MAGKRRAASVAAAGAGKTGRECRCADEGDPVAGVVCGRGDVGVGIKTGADGGGDGGGDVGRGGDGGRCGGSGSGAAFGARVGIDASLQLDTPKSKLNVSAMTRNINMRLRARCRRRW